VVSAFCEKISSAKDIAYFLIVNDYKVNTDQIANPKRPVVNAVEALTINERGSSLGL
jgi:hypothetical protein